MGNEFQNLGPAKVKLESKCFWICARCTTNHKQSQVLILSIGLLPLVLTKGQYGMMKGQKYCGLPLSMSV